jgi:hypothetical protein
MNNEIVLFEAKDGSIAMPVQTRDYMCKICIFSRKRG